MLQNLKLAVMCCGLAAIGLAQPGLAGRIVCEDGYQRVQGNLIATPYCQDAYLAQVAREFGAKATAERVRNNPNYKREVCRLVGRDIRVQQNCVDDDSLGRGRR